MPWGWASRSALAAVHLRDAALSEAGLRFQREASDAKHLIERRILSYVEIIHGLRALFAARDDLGRVEFHRYVTSLELPRNFPGFELLNYAAHVPASERLRFEQGVRRDRSLQPAGYPGFAIRPPGERASHHVLVYLEPMQGNEAAFGLDISANPRVQEAAAAARDTGELTASGRLVLTKGDPGLAMRMAVYRSGVPLETVEQRRAAYAGSVGAGFNVRKLMRGALAAGSPAYLRFRLLDVGPASRDPAAGQPPGELLFDSEYFAAGAAPPRSDADDRGAQYAAVFPLQIGGRAWELRFHAPRGAVVGARDRLLPWLALCAGVVSSLLLFGMFHKVASSRARALVMAEEIRQRKAELEQAVSELEAFSYSVSHDLRAPLRHMSGYAGLLRETWRALDDDTAQRYLARITDAASRMGALIDDLLAFSRTSRTPLRLQRVDLAALVEDVRGECLREAGERPIEWRIGPLPAVEADAALLRVVFVNLVANAVKFTAKREGAIVEIGGEQRSSGEALIHVRDNGAGFDMRHAEKLFGVFQRLHFRGRVPRHRHRAGHGPAHRPPPWRPGLGARCYGRGGDVLPRLEDSSAGRALRPRSTRRGLGLAWAPSREADMLRRGIVPALVVCLTTPAATAVAEGVNKLAIRQAEAAFVIATGALKVRLTLVTGQALDYEFTDPERIGPLLKFIEIAANGGFLSAEISTDGKTLRALHIGTAPGSGQAPEGARRR